MRWFLGAFAVLFTLVGFLVVAGRFWGTPPVAAPQAGVDIDKGRLFEGAALAAAVAEAGLERTPLDTGALRIAAPAGRGSPSPADRGVWIALSQSASFLTGAAARVEIEIANPVNVRAIAVSLQGRGAVAWEEALPTAGGAVALAPLPATGPPERLGVFLVAAEPTRGASADLVRIALVGLPEQTAEGVRARVAPPASDQATPVAVEEETGEIAETEGAAPPQTRTRPANQGHSGPWDATLEDL